MATDNILTENQKKSIRRAIAQTFAEDLNGHLTVNLNQFRNQINLVLRQMSLVPEAKKYKFLNHTRTKNMIAAKGYLLIFKFRQFLLDEEIDYRYYYFDPKEGYSKAVSFTEDNLIDYIKFGKNAIQINPTPLKKSEINAEYTAFASHFFTLYTVPDVNDYMRLIVGPSYSGRVVRSKIMNTYGRLNSGLRNKRGGYQMFTRGHIYEAIDDAATEVMKNDEVGTDEIITKYVFGKYLAYDNIKASQGGDNPLTNTSIKSESADLYDYNTIRDQLIEIKAILDAGLVNPEIATEKIEKLFMNKTKYTTDKDFERSAQNALNNLLKLYPITQNET